MTELADISLDTGASYIYHEFGERYIPVKFSVRDRDLAGAVAEAQRRIAANVKLPGGYRIVWAGEFEDLQNAQARLAIIVPISLLLIVVLLYGLFNSLRDSLMVLAGIPFAAGGGILALYLSGLHFSISAAVGFISLFGVSVMNGILVMTYFNETRRPASGHGGRHVSRRLTTHATDADDGLICVYWPFARGRLDRHWQPSAASACHGRRRRNVSRSDHPSGCCTGDSGHVPWSRRKRRRRRAAAAGRVSAT